MKSFEIREQLIELAEELEMSFAISNVDFRGNLSNLDYYIVIQFGKCPPISRIKRFIIRAEEITNRFPMVDVIKKEEHSYYYPDYDDREPSLVRGDLINFLESNRNCEKMFLGF